MEHDNKQCKNKIFRGENTCRDYSYIYLGINWGKEKIMIVPCWCICHKGKTRQESWEKGKKELETKGYIIV